LISEYDGAVANRQGANKRPACFAYASCSDVAISKTSNASSGLALSFVDRHFSI